jgi:hypothetical protein
VEQRREAIHHGSKRRRTLHHRLRNVMDLVLGR